MKNLSHITGHIMIALFSGFVLLLIGSIIASEMYKDHQKNQVENLCTEIGYHGVHEEETKIGADGKFRCYKKVSTGIGYEYEYSGYIDPPTK